MDNGIVAVAACQMLETGRRAVLGWPELFVRVNALL
jgi:hypothetical protein